MILLTDASIILYPVSSHLIYFYSNKAKHQRTVLYDNYNIPLCDMVYSYHIVQVVTTQYRLMYGDSEICSY